MLPRLAELLLFGILPFLVGSFVGPATEIADDENVAIEVRTVEAVDIAAAAKEKSFEIERANKV